ncbi:uncharacterized protein LOC4576107 [Anopheles gambiae]|uniref:uncharacterized protein LOC4576107 n=1 Tax=Anopheles gambiae TaxID=7165 RepID=UPI002AC98250|nr:uncharacterized protein LOC4576107 [Anopheles gambiae]XP_061504525.1 uncharacterized protein LOC4576107 [Anopheles gambiae]XP_061504530.1 uncharacterized protein LOC4576107 [Anopheles gambiae]XP_061504538.1 uncharacterized protein LOC4576107 [Anopheles gambiae]
MNTEPEPMDTDEVPEYESSSSRDANREPRVRSSCSIRKLNVQPKKDDRRHAKNNSPAERSGSMVWKILKTLLLLAGIGTLGVYLGASNHFYQELKHQYHMAHEQLAQEMSALCSKRPANFTPILQAVEDAVIGQPHLAAELGHWFQTVGKTPLTCALFVGGTGVGKSLTASLLAKHYPYPANVLHVTGSEYSDERKRYAAFKATLFRIQRAALTHGNCAHYLLVMDHVSLDGARLVTRICERLRAISKQYHLQLQMVFVFQAEAPRKLRQATLLAESIPEARLFEFRPIGSSELEECIRREADKLGMELDTVTGGYVVQQVAKQINATRHGCKPVRAKLSLYSLEPNTLQP